MTTRIMGVDEAGRGPVLGPMVICGAVFTESTDLAELGLKDSKVLSPKKRRHLDTMVRERANAIGLAVIPAVDIDARPGSLNELETVHMARLINELVPDVVFIDAPERNCARFAEKLQAHLTCTPRIVAENKADARYPVVSAASIIAKVARDSAIDALRVEYGDIGSGYPSDPTTCRWLADWYATHNDLPPIVRHSWATAQKLVGSTRQRTLADFTPH